MALAGPAITSAIIAAGPTLKGADFLKIASAVGNGVASWALIPANLALQGVTTGVVGGGVVNGKVFVVPAPLVPGSVASVGLLGMMAPTLAQAVGIGVATAFNASAQYQGVSSGVGVGTDVSKVSVANGPSLILMLQGVMNSSGLVGGDVPRLASGLGTGIAALLLTGTGAGAVTGPAGPSPAGGTSISRVF
jgi:hypothetical protein